ncbi:hypothetical protein WG907_03365 [Sphingobium sp. AN558]|uniref:hypothetical protein n=1 Tax=Sphingobium sp. AN558 TaxID=3133442 RepID=UPI0030C47389
MKWRDERAATARAPDTGITVLRELLKFGRLRGRININVTDGIPRLYKGGDRAAIIWTPEDMEAFGGSKSFGMVRDKAKIVHFEEGEDGEPVERAKHLHDVRGTFCTYLLTDCELTDEQAALIMGWSSARVGKIRSTYVDTAAVVISLAERMRAKHGAKQTGSAA